MRLFLRSYAFILAIVHACVLKCKSRRASYQVLFSGLLLLIFNHTVSAQTYGWVTFSGLSVTREAGVADASGAMQAGLRASLSARKGDAVSQIDMLEGAKVLATQNCAVYTCACTPTTATDVRTPPHRR